MQGDYLGAQTLDLLDEGHALGGVDRPRTVVVGGAAELPTALLFLGVLGGLQVYGVLGGLISPLVIAGVIAFARIYRESYLEAPPVKAP